KTFTLRFDFQPRWHSSLRFSGTYYNISYTDRIAIPPTNGIGVLLTPNLFPNTIYRAPSAAHIEEILRSSTNTGNSIGLDLSDPHAAAATLFADPTLWLLDLRVRNLSLSDQDGFDLSVSDTFDTDWGQAHI